MLFLLDTNILIPAEPTNAVDIEPTTAAIVDLLRAIAEGGHRPLFHPASMGEVLGDRNQQRRDTRALLLGKYSELQQPPRLNPTLISTLGSPRPGSHDEIDLLILSAIQANAVDYLVTEDRGLHRRAGRTGLSSRVLSVAEALATIRALFPSIPEPPPLVLTTLAHGLDSADPIFDSFRHDYPGFDKWLDKCKREQRQAWVIGPTSPYAGVCIVKEELQSQLSATGRILKICSFKISDNSRGFRYGELLLKTIFSYVLNNDYGSIYVEAFPKQEYLLNIFGEFGFEDVAETARGERILLKHLVPTTQHEASLAPLAFNIKYGPNAIKSRNTRSFVVPIRPQYHRILFPECEKQLLLGTEVHPFGNSIRKAYLCHSQIRQVEPGNVLLFYRSQDHQAITAIGVAEETLVSDDAAEIARYVGKRTVYPYSEIKRMAEKPVLALLFRLSRTLGDPWPLDLLKRAGIVKRAPESIMEVRKEAIEWIADQLGV